jgi:hypothetical protein
MTGSNGQQPTRDSNKCHLKRLDIIACKSL